MQYTDTVYASHTPSFPLVPFEASKTQLCINCHSAVCQNRWNPLLCQSLAVAPRQLSLNFKPIGLNPFPKRQGRGVLTTWVAPNDVCFSVMFDF